MTNPTIVINVRPPVGLYLISWPYLVCDTDRLNTLETVLDRLGASRAYRRAMRASARYLLITITPTGVIVTGTTIPLLQDDLTAALALVKTLGGAVDLALCLDTETVVRDPAATIWDSRVPPLKHRIGSMADLSQYLHHKPEGDPHANS